MRKHATYIVILLILLLQLPFAAMAQKEYNMWVFGMHNDSAANGLDFNFAPPRTFTVPNRMVYHPSVICDSTGSLSFYSDSWTTWNKEHNKLLNSITQGGTTATQTTPTLMIKLPGNDSLYYHFKVKHASFPNPSFFLYDIININGDNDLGEFVERKHVNNISRAYLTATHHADGNSYWIAVFTHDPSANEQKILVYHFDSTGVDTTPTIFPANNYQLTGWHQMRFSADGSKMTGNDCDLYKFDNATGQLSGLISLREYYNTAFPDDRIYYRGREFSPDGRYLYVAEHQYLWAPPHTDTSRIVQYDLSVWHPDSIVKSRKIVYETAGTHMANLLLLGPDGKIYIPRRDSWLGVIHFPDLPSPTCHYVHDGIKLDRHSGSNLPNVVTSTYKLRDINLGPDTLLCEGDSLLLSVVLNPGDKATWSTGDTLPFITVKQSGTYYITVTADTLLFSDTVKVSFNPKPTVYIGPDSAFCGWVDYIIQSQATNADKYQWNTGDTTKTLHVNKEGMYSLRVSNGPSCHDADTVYIDKISYPYFPHRQDTLLCGAASYTLDTGNHGPGIEYLWSTGDTVPVITVHESGTYHVTISNSFCSINDSMKVQFVPEDECQKELSVFVPNAFTPGGLNPVFKAEGENVERWSMKIFNRWGEKLYVSTDFEEGWDGTYKGSPCPEGKYIYLIEAKGIEGGKEILKGSFMLLR